MDTQLGNTRIIFRFQRKRKKKERTEELTLFRWIRRRRVITMKGMEYFGESLFLRERERERKRMREKKKVSSSSN